jgi:integrase
MRNVGISRARRIAITMDVYGHLFPRGDDGAELAAAEQALLA